MDIGHLEKHLLLHFMTKLGCGLFFCQHPSPLFSCLSHCWFSLQNTSDHAAFHALYARGASIEIIYFNTCIEITLTAIKCYLSKKLNAQKVCLTSFI